MLFAISSLVRGYDTSERLFIDQYLESILQKTFQSSDNHNLNLIKRLLFFINAILPSISTHLSITDLDRIVKDYFIPFIYQWFLVDDIDLRKLSTSYKYIS